MSKIIIESKIEDTLTLHYMTVPIYPDVSEQMSEAIVEELFTKENIPTILKYCAEVLEPLNKVS